MIGVYVKYKDNFYVITSETHCLYQLLDVNTNKKLMVSHKNVEIQTQWKPMLVIEYKGTNYLVSVKGLIISLTSKRVMDWDVNHGMRKVILHWAAQQA